ncbi:MAG: mannitol dehydrogenase family protein [Treponemataceae bacterium]|nr:mannitol dehydrogenase family protein [Treponemataceae bacterium]
MLELNKRFLFSESWKDAKVSLPSFNVDEVNKKTFEAPEWLHFGAGNIFRGFIAVLQQRLLNEGLADKGIIASDTFDYEILDKIYAPHDNLSLLVLMKADGSLEKEIVASVSEAVHADSSDFSSWERMKTIFRSSSLKMVSFTITEKGYSITNMDGSINKLASADMQSGPAHPVHAMSIVTALAYERFCNGAYPIAFVSMDNCSHNGEKLSNSVYAIAEAWFRNGFVSKDFVEWLHDEKKVAFPWSMIDKITPRPAAAVQKQLEEAGIVGMDPITTSKGTFIAPFVNSEKPQYLVIEDSFPAGRPAFEKLKDCGVYITDRDTVNRTEQMKVTTCLNPLHTALAVYGCLLGYKSIAEEMKNPLLVKLIKKIGYDEGLPVVVNPGILNPLDFINEVVEERVPNPYIPDTPQRIATDTSQKIPVRYGETIKAYIKAEKNIDFMIGIPLAIAGWLRYLIALDDDGAEMALSSDPMLNELKSSLKDVVFGKPETAKGVLKPLLSNPVIFGVDLYSSPYSVRLTDKIEEIFCKLISGVGSVKAVLEEYLK